MTPDSFQEAWQSQSSHSRVTIAADLLLKELQRNQQDFQTTIIGRDLREVGIGLVMIPVWFFLGAMWSLPWSWYLTVPALIWIVGFILVDRMRQCRRPVASGGPLVDSVQDSLTDVAHQIWLLRNIFWWYLLPPTISILFFFAHVTWQSSRDWAGALPPALIVVGVYAFIYYLNQLAVRTRLEPRRQELLILLANLEDETNSAPQTSVTGGASAEIDSMANFRAPVKRWSSVAFIGVLAAVTAVASVAAHYAGHQWAGYPKLSPFTAVRWEGEQPEVQVDGRWFKLVSLNDLPATEIIAFSQQTYGDLWRKRFEEDLVELLSRMGHPPEDTVTLVVQPLDGSEKATLKNVPMTKGNRQAIRDAAQAREWGDSRPARNPAVPIDDEATFRSRIDKFLAAAHAKAGFSGAVIVARGGEPVYEGAFGISHLETRAPNTLDTPFRIASLSKQFTAAVVFRLEGQGKLNVDDAVYEYLPEFGDAPYREITIHHLLTHTSGLPRIATGWTGPLRWNSMSRSATPVDDYVRLSVQMPLEFAPGTGFEYSNFGYRVLAALIARVTGREYADFMEEEIFRPLGMNDSGVARVTRPSSEDRIAEGLTLLELDRDGTPTFAHGEEGRNFGTGYGSGGIYASANDLLRWDRALAGNEFLTDSQKKRLFQPVHAHYACGWFVKKSGLDGRLYQMHNGANDGFFSQMMRVPEDDLAIIAVGNVDTTEALDDVIGQLFRLCRSLPYRDP